MAHHAETTTMAAMATRLQIRPRSCHRKWAPMPTRAPMAGARATV